MMTNEEKEKRRLRRNELKRIWRKNNPEKVRLIAEKRKEYYKKYRKKNKEKIRQYHKEHYKEQYERRKLKGTLYYQKHKEKKKLYDKTYNKDHKKERLEYYKKYNKSTKMIKWYKEYRIKNKKRINEYRKNRRGIDLNFKIKGCLRTRFYMALKNNYKSGSAVKDLGCTIDYFKSYIESKFKEGMTWDNHGRTGWHLDHIIPLDSFNLSNRNECIKALHYTNYQPLWYYDNISKKNKILMDQ